jgi:hypothetical protein
LVFQAVKSLFGIEFSPEQIKAAAAKYSMENNRKLEHNFTPYMGYDGDELQIGVHLHEGEVGTWRRFVEDHDFINARLAKQMKILGYPLT